MNCPHCGKTIVKRLDENRAGAATQLVLRVLDGAVPGHTMRASEVTAPGLTPRQINNAFCYLWSRGLVERVRYGHYRKSI